MLELPRKDEETKIPVSGEIEYETHLSKKELVEFLKGLIDQIETGETVDLKVENHEIRFEYGEPVEVEMEFENEKKLKIKLEFKQRSKIQFI